MRIGYSYWGFLGDNKLDKDYKELSTPDGNATYSWSIIREMQMRGHIVYAMQEDRDWYAWDKFRTDNFAAFAKEKRFFAYENLIQTDGVRFPDLDVLLLEWRFPIPGRNMVEVETDLGIMGRVNPEHQPDWGRQIDLLNHYKEKDTKIVFWDLDHKLTIAEEESWDPDAIFETSSRPLELSMKRTPVEPPIDISVLTEHPTLPPDSSRRLAYIGSRYERDDVIDEWIKPISEAYPQQVEFHGKWDKDSQERWPNIKFGERCTVKDFRKIYGSACGVPLLAKRSYLETGFITPRIWEALMFGSIPIGLKTHNQISKYLDPSLVAHDAVDLASISGWLSRAPVRDRDRVRRECVERIEFMDAKYFVDKIEAV